MTAPPKGLTTAGGSAPAIAADPPPAPTDLRSIVLELADAQGSGLKEDAKLAVLEAFDGDWEPESAGETGPVRSTRRPEAVYLSEIAVTGFRGVGPEARLPLKPGPGLTVVSGRNGCGKSSFAEALELALTGDSFRWQCRTAVWSQDWRNLHSPSPTAIRVGLVQEHAGSVTIGVDWAADADLGGADTWVQRPRSRREHGSDVLDWSDSLAMFRPLLSYDELGTVLGGQPKELYDKLNGLLGLERITAAQRILDERTKELQQPEVALKAQTALVKSMLAGSDDERARSVTAILAKRSKYVDAIQALAVGGNDSVPDPVQGLRDLAALVAPDAYQADSAARDLREAVGALAALSTTATEQSLRSAELLRKALDLHDSHGAQPCPVCGVGILDARWAEDTRTALAREVDQLGRLREARQSVDIYRDRARALIASTSVPVSIDGLDIAELAPAQMVYQRWRLVPSGDLELAAHLDRLAGPLNAHYALLRAKAAELVAEREDYWQPVARQLVYWVELARRAEAVAAEAEDAKAASTWLKKNTVVLRNQRIAPLADQARSIWAKLRQESNVDLGAVRLEGTATRRHVELQASVDGVETGALGVMSQGELHALALALFLPRATSPESPFRFVVLDDPVQAMDPSKVEGFVDVLCELAKDRQVIVMSHDDRLADAIRRSKVRASLYEVIRGSQSQVQVVEALHPAQRYVEDAWALCKDEAVPDDARRRVVPALCRQALEAAAFEVFTNRSYRQGCARPDVEARWDSARRVRGRIGLAIGAVSDTEVTTWLRAGPARSSALRVVNGEVHQSTSADLLDGVKDVRQAVIDLRGIRT